MTKVNSDESKAITLPIDWYTYVVAHGVDTSAPGLYEWIIDGVGSYIGKYTHVGRPTKEYQNNVTKLLTGGLTGSLSQTIPTDESIGLSFQQT